MDARYVATTCKNGLHFGPCEIMVVTLSKNFSSSIIYQCAKCHGFLTKSTISPHNLLDYLYV